MSHNLPLSILGFPQKNSALDIGPLIKVLSKGIWASTLSITWTFQLFLIWHLKSRMQFSVMRLNAGNLNGCLLHRFCSPNPLETFHNTFDFRRKFFMISTHFGISTMRSTKLKGPADMGAGLWLGRSAVTSLSAHKHGSSCLECCNSSCRHKNSLYAMPVIGSNF